MKTLKTKNWQDVTIEELKEEYWYLGHKEIPNPIPFDIARLMNAVAFGVHGDGIDVRCAFQNEAVEIFKGSCDFAYLSAEYKKRGWEDCGRFGETYEFVKLDTKVALHVSCTNVVNFMDVEFLSDYSDDAFNVKNYYNDIEVEESVVDCLKKALSYISDEKSVAERFLEGRDSFSETDCEYIIKGCEWLEKALEKLEKENK